MTLQEQDVCPIFILLIDQRIEVIVNVIILYVLLTFETAALMHYMVHCIDSRNFVCQTGPTKSFYA